LVLRKFSIQETLATLAWLKLEIMSLAK
jgi:hypothetical protein